MHRQFTPEEAVVLIALDKNERTDGLSDNQIQRAVGRSPILEAVDWLAQAQNIVPATNDIGKVLSRRWRITDQGRVYLKRQLAAIARDAAARVQSTATVPEESSRYRELQHALELAMKEYGVVDAPKPKAAALGPDYEQREPEEQTVAGDLEPVVGIASPTPAGRTEPAAPAPAAVANAAGKPAVAGAAGAPKRLS
jgi:hypothetical protein